jgi:Flp pilus assembly protein TadD
MRIPQRPNLSLVLLLSLCTVPLATFQVKAQPNSAQAEPNASDQEKRQNAVTLFNQGKRLEALQTLEDLVQKNPQDAELLVYLGASLIDHAATLTDQNAAAKERFRARDLVQKGDCVHLDVSAGTRA